MYKRCACLSHESSFKSPRMLDGLGDIGHLLSDVVVTPSSLQTPPRTVTFLKERNDYDRNKALLSDG